MRQRFLLIGMLALVGTLVVWSVARSPRSPAAPSAAQPIERAEDSEAPRAPVELDASPRADSVRASAAVERAASDAANATPSATTDSELATLHVHVSSKTAHTPVAGVRVSVAVQGGAWDSNPIDSSTANLHESPLTGADGVAVLRVESGHTLELHVDGSAASAESVGREVAALAPGERRDVELEVHTDHDRRVVVRVVDAETQLPIEHAEVSERFVTEWKYGRDGEREARVTTLHSHETDADGRTSLGVKTYLDTHLSANAKGYATALETPRAGFESAEHPLVMPLHRSGTLRVHVHTAAGIAMTDAAVDVRVDGWLLRANKDDTPLLMGAYFDLPSASWHVPVVGSGIALVEELPTNVVLDVKAVREKETLRQAIPPVELKPGETRDIEWTIGSGTTVTGTVVDQHGAPVARREMWLVNRTDHGYVDARAGASAMARATTDSNGRFRFVDVVAGTWGIVVSPPESRYPRTLDPDAIAPVPQTVSVAGEATLDVRILVYRGLYVRGRVETPAGTPCPGGGYVSMDQASAWDGQSAGSDGTFVLGPLVPGTCRVTAAACGEFAASDRVDVEPGQDDVVLHLRMGSGIRGRVVDGATGAPVKASFDLVPEHAHDSLMGSGFESSTSDDGSFEFLGLEPDTYSLVFATEDGRFGSLPSVVADPGGVSSDHVVRLTPGGTLRMRYEGRAPRAWYETRWEGGRVHFEQPLVAATWAERRVPAGRLVVTWGVHDGTPTSKKTIDVAPGQTVSVTLTDLD